MTLLDFNGNSFSKLNLNSNIIKADDGGVKFNAASPDEKALVEGVEEFGYAFVGKTSNSMTIRTNNNTEEVYEVLATIDFTSARKRMSILVRTPSGKIKLYIKPNRQCFVMSLPRLRNYLYRTLMIKKKIKFPSVKPIQQCLVMCLPT